MGWWWYETEVCSAAVEERAAFYARPEAPGAYCRCRAGTGAQVGRQGLPFRGIFPRMRDQREYIYYLLP